MFISMAYISEPVDNEKQSPREHLLCNTKWECNTSITV